MEQTPAPQARPAGSNRSWLIALSIILGIFFSCTLLPLGAFALLLAAGSGGGSVGPVPAISWDEQVVEGAGANRIVIIDVTGAIGGATDLFSTQLSQQEIISQIRQAARDGRVRALVLRVDSPGGGVVASNEIHAELQKFRDTGKPLVVSMGSVAASGGYYISTPAQRIYANPDTLTGSLGVILATLNYEEAFEWLGLQSIVYKSGEMKDIGSPTRATTAEEMAVLQSIVDDAFDGFVQVIVDGRGMDEAQVRTLADGRLYTGRQAYDLGLVDALGNLDAALEGAKELAGIESAMVVRYTRVGSLRSILMSNLEQPQAPNDPLGLRVLTDPPVPILEYRWQP
ncbi:signal peptide peptidase SppA [Candidatus Viridilinea mediisalina]|uniref:Signal peptide peptidase SppA n=1 Tax=Candidatus Viridilinea mediisalina TaxID=2024553 RepID=A0A2A6RLA0_9CHLR|nr:signal peptide peptidase SppA [Candidatus Viridilinea mediisalina]PDW03703.1 signal peptide peptidase SppA [Candidatus Viridilinea mediisalina]